jgi:hypothetical protein
MESGKGSRSAWDALGFLGLDRYRDWCYTGDMNKAPGFMTNAQIAEEGFREESAMCAECGHDAAIEDHGPECRS